MSKKRSDMTGIKVLVVGNSVSLSPREGVPGYVDLLESDGRWEIIRIIQRGATIRELASDVMATLEKEKPRAVILQVGIVECSPRPLTQRERQWLSRLKQGPLKNLIIRLIHVFRRRIIRARGLNQRMSLDEFDKALGRILERFTVPVAIVPIPHVPVRIERRSPGFNDEVDRYNNALRSKSTDTVVCLEIFNEMLPEELYDNLHDIHLNGIVHRSIASALSYWLEGCPKDMGEVISAS